MFHQKARASAQEADPGMNTDLLATLESALARETQSQVQVSGLAQMAGGASRELWRLDVEVADGEWAGRHPLVMQRPLGGKIHAHALDLRQEFIVRRAAHKSGLPVPRPYWLLENFLGGWAALAERLEGETIGRKIVKDARWETARAKLPGQMGATLASIHRIDLDQYELWPVLPSPPPGLTPAQWHIQQMEADLDRIREPHPAIELCLRWLRRHEPPLPKRLSLVHGDYRIGNVIIGPEGLRGVLDWEFAHIGDRMEDVSWGVVRDWRFGMDGLRYGGVGQPEAFWAAYQAAGGEPVIPARARYWEVMGNARWAVGTLNQAERYLSGQEDNLEFASLGRRCAEMELEALRLISGR
jgi:aminoglycoside phosphotransferase (APT) family kinase protein